MRLIAQPMISFLGLMFVAFPLAAQESKQRMDPSLVYRSLEERARKDANSLIESMFSVFKDGKTPTGMRVTPEVIRQTRELAMMRTYQDLIDIMICYEEAGKQPNVMVCISDKTSKSKEMLKFNVEYGSRVASDPRLSACLIKSRLLDAELRYPPYPFMIEDSKTSLEAYDAKIFLECVKSRL